MPQGASQEVARPVLTEEEVAGGSPAGLGFSGPAHTPPLNAVLTGHVSAGPRPSGLLPPTLFVWRVVGKLWRLRTPWGAH